MNEPYLVVDIGKLKDLKATYVDVMKFIAQDYPELNLQSSAQVKHFFKQCLGTTIDSTKVSELENALKLCTDQTVQHDLIQGVIYYKKMFYTIKNYIDHFLKKNINGKVFLTRDPFGVTLTNHRPLPSSPEILDCIIGAGGGIEIIFNNNNEATGFKTKEKVA